MDFKLYDFRRKRIEFEETAYQRRRKIEFREIAIISRDTSVEIFVLQRFQVMKDWSDLEEKYQDIRAHDPVAADAFKRWMTARFQETVAALEESGAAEKHQLSAMHQQRVQVCDLE